MREFLRNYNILALLIPVIFVLVPVRALNAQASIFKKKKETLLNDSLPITTHPEIVVYGSRTIKCYYIKTTCSKFWRIHNQTIASGADTSGLRKTDRSKSESISLFPNPLNNEQKAFIKYQDLKPGKYNIFIADTQGRTLFSQTVTLQNEAGQIEPGSRLPKSAGTWWLRIVNEHGKQVYAGTWIKL